MKTKKASVSVIFLIFTTTILIILGIYVSTYISSQEEYIGENINEENITINGCGDGTEYNVCSEKVSSYYCEEGQLIKKASLCGCPEDFIANGDNCASAEYGIGAKEIGLDYVLRGEKKILKFIVYQGVYDYLAGLPREMTTIDVVPTLADFKYRNIEEEIQRDFLLDLVVVIQNLAPTSKEDQARIAISIVQNIPYGFSDKNSSSPYGVVDIGYTRYPYETLYEQQGLCGEKSELLVFLLKEIGYDAIFLRYFEENHEVVGIKCPKEYSLHGSGYCFVEATRPSIITDSFGSYQGIGTLSSIPAILDTSENNKISLPNNMYEYKDARDWVVANKALNGFFGWLNKRSKDKKLELEIKYGL